MRRLNQYFQIPTTSIFIQFRPGPIKTILTTFFHNFKTDSNIFQHRLGTILVTAICDFKTVLYISFQDNSADTCFSFTRRLHGFKWQFFQQNIKKFEYLVELCQNNGRVQVNLEDLSYIQPSCGSHFMSKFITKTLHKLDAYFPNKTCIKS